MYYFSFMINSNIHVLFKEPLTSFQPYLMEDEGCCLEKDEATVRKQSSLHILNVLENRIMQYRTMYKHYTACNFIFR